MKHIHEDDLELYLLGRLSENEASRLESHVIGCGQCGARLNDAVQFIRQLAGVQRRPGGAGTRRSRTEARIPTDDPADARVYDPLLSRAVSVRVLNASKGGLMLHTSNAFKVQALIQLRLKSAVIVGEVCYCSPVKDGFHVGVRIQASHAHAEDVQRR